MHIGRQYVGSEVLCVYRTDKDAFDLSPLYHQENTIVDDLAAPVPRMTATQSRIEVFDKILWADWWSVYSLIAIWTVDIHHILIDAPPEFCTFSQLIFIELNDLHVAFLLMSTNKAPKKTFREGRLLFPF